MSGERIRVDDLPPLDSAEHLDSLATAVAYAKDVVQAGNRELVNAAAQDIAHALTNNQSLRGMDVEAVARAIEAEAGGPLAELRGALAEYCGLKENMRVQRLRTCGGAVLMPTPEEDAAIDAGIAADPDTLEISEEVAAAMLAFDQRKNTLRAVEARESRPYTLGLTFGDGAAFDVDLQELIHRHPTLRALADPAVFRQAKMGAGGAIVTWGTDALELAADNLRALTSHDPLR